MDKDAELSVALKELTEAEEEKHSWRLRCFEAEAEVRLLKRRIDEAPRIRTAVPDCGTLRELQEQAAALELSGMGRLREIAAIRLRESVHIQRTHSAEEAARTARRRSAEAEARLKALKERHASDEEERQRHEASLCWEHNVLKARIEASLHSERVLEQHEEEHRVGEEAVTALSSELQEEEAVLEHLHTEFEDHRPRLEELRQSCSKTAASTERLRRGAQQRAEEVEMLQATMTSEELEADTQQQFEEEQLRECQAELAQVSESIGSMDTEMQVLKKRQARQLGAARKGNQEVQEVLELALQEQAFEDNEVHRMRDLFEEIDASRGSCAEALDATTMYVEELQREATIVEIGFETEDEARRTEEQQLMVARTENEALQKKNTILQRDTCRTVQEAQGAEKVLAEMRRELCEARLELEAAEAQWPQADDRVRLHEQADNLREKGERLREQRDTLRSESEQQTQRRQDQLSKRKEIFREATQLKAQCGDLLRDVRGNARKNVSATAATNGVGEKGAMKGTGKLGQQIDSLIDLLEDAVATASNDGSLRSIVQEAESSTTSRLLEEKEQQTELLDQEKQKVQAQRRSLREATESHASEQRRILSERESAAEDLRRCRDELESARKRTEEDQDGLRTEIEEFRAMASEMQQEASVDIDIFLQQRTGHVRDLQRLQTELQEELWRLQRRSTSSYSVPDTCWSVLQRLERREAERDELRDQFLQYRDRCSDLSGELSTIRIEHEEELAALENVDADGTLLEDAEARRLQKDWRPLEQRSKAIELRDKFELRDKESEELKQAITALAEKRDQNGKDNGDDVGPEDGSESIANSSRTSTKRASVLLRRAGSERTIGTKPQRPMLRRAGSNLESGLYRSGSDTPASEGLGSSVIPGASAYAGRPRTIESSKSMPLLLPLPRTPNTVASLSPAASPRVQPRVGSAIMQPMAQAVWQPHRPGTIQPPLILGDHHNTAGAGRMTPAWGGSKTDSPRLRSPIGKAPAAASAYGSVVPRVPLSTSPRPYTGPIR